MYCIERRARINNLTARSTFKLQRNTPHTTLMNNQGDISSLCQFGWYDWCYFRDHGASFPFGKEVLGRVLGPARGAGNEMCQWVLKVNGQVVARRTLWPLRLTKYTVLQRNANDRFSIRLSRRDGEQRYSHRKLIQDSISNHTRMMTKQLEPFRT